MSDSSDRLNQAEGDYNSTTNFFSLWLHFKIQEEETTIYYKTKVHISKEDAEATTDNAYASAMGEYLTIGEDEDTPSPVVAPNTGGNNPPSILSTDCSQSDCDLVSSIFDPLKEVKKYKAYCCWRPSATQCATLCPEGDCTFCPGTFELGITAGLFDGLAETLIFVYDASGGLSKAISHLPLTKPWFFEVFKKTWVEGNIKKALENQINDDINFWTKIGASIEALYENFDSSAVLVAVKNMLQGFFNDLNPLTGLFTTGYQVGKIAFEILLDGLTGGGNLALSISKITREGLEYLVDIGKAGGIASFKSKTLAVLEISKNTVKKVKCRVLGTGCFITGTSVLTAGIVDQNIEQLDCGNYVLAYKSTPHSPSQVSLGNDLYAPTKRNLLVSDQQLAIDAIELDKQQWYTIEIKLIQADGHISNVKILRPQKWLEENQIKVKGDILWLSFPEQSLHGLAKIIEIQTFTAEKIPLDNDPNDNFVLRPITGIFEHTSNDVWEIQFDNQDTLGVTSTHPFLSYDFNDWRFAGELEVGEQIISKNELATVKSITKLEGEHSVYNIEVKGLHNYLVGKNGLVVHNSCATSDLIDFRNGASFDISFLLENPKLLFAVQLPDAKFNLFLSEVSRLGKINVELVKAWDALIASPNLRKVTDNLTHVDNYVAKHPNSLSSIKSNFNNLPEARRQSFVNGVRNGSLNPLDIPNARRATPDEVTSSVNKIADHRASVGNSSSGNYGYLEGNVGNTVSDGVPVRSGSPDTDIPEIFDAIAINNQNIPGGEGAWVRTTDSEYKMLNRLANELGAEAGGVYPSLSGSLKIASERSYCPSCAGVIQQFNQMFPNVDLILVDGIR